MNTKGNKHTPRIGNNKRGPGRDHWRNHSKRAAHHKLTEDAKPPKPDTRGVEWSIGIASPRLPR